MEVGATWVMAAVDSVRDAVVVGLAAAAAVEGGAVLATAGTLVERWLFFAEARHVVTLYYGADRV